MCGDNCAWVERLNFVECRDPTRGESFHLTRRGRGERRCRRASPATTRPTDGTFKQVVWSVSVWPSSTATKSCPSRSITLPLSSSAIDEPVWDSRPGNPAFQNLSRNSGEACWRITLTTSGVATALAFGNRSRSLRFRTNDLHGRCVDIDRLGFSLPNPIH